MNGAGTPDDDRLTQELRCIYSMLHRNSEGEVEASELLRVFCNFKELEGKKWTKEDNNRVFASMDTEGKASVDEKHFVAFFWQDFPLSKVGDMKRAIAMAQDAPDSPLFVAMPRLTLALITVLISFGAVLFWKRQTSSTCHTVRATPGTTSTAVAAPAVAAAAVALRPR